VTKLRADNRQRRWLAIPAVMALALAGCSSGTASPEAARPTSGFAIFTGNIHLRGEIRVDGQFTDAITGRGETCAQYAAGSVPASTLWVTPTPNNAELVAGHSISFTAGIAGSGLSFRGSGVYSQPAAQVDVLVLDNSSFLAGDSPTTVITITSSGAGSMTFSGMTDTSSGAAESGTESWSCESGAAPMASSEVTSPSTVAPAGSPILQGTVIITGAYTSSGSFTTHAEFDMSRSSFTPPAAPSCADYARGVPDAPHQSRSFVGPEIDTGGANAVYFNTVLATGYAGPGTYASQSAPALSGSATITIPPASAPQFDTFTSRYGGRTVLTVEADGSGIVQMIGWRSGGSDSRISGTVSWTCTAAG